MAFPYAANKTMQLLGRQHSVKLFWSNEQVREEVREISEGRPYSFTLDAAADIFMLGYIHGKRAERARRNKIK